MWEQCDGKGFPTLACPSRACCSYQNEWYSQCVPRSQGACVDPPPKVECGDGFDIACKWETCGGRGNPSRECEPGACCDHQSRWYAQCVPESQGCAAPVRSGRRGGRRGRLLMTGA